jgi:hypothetical protein
MIVKDHVAKKMDQFNLSVMIVIKILFQVVNVTHLVKNVVISLIQLMILIVLNVLIKQTICIKFGKTELVLVCNSFNHSHNIQS